MSRHLISTTLSAIGVVLADHLRGYQEQRSGYHVKRREFIAIRQTQRFPWARNKASRHHENDEKIRGRERTRNVRLAGIAVCESAMPYHQSLVGKRGKSTRRPYIHYTVRPVPRVTATA